MTPSGRIGLGIVTLFVALAVLAPLLVADDPMMPALPETLAGPTLRHPLGQDRLGRDLWSRTLYGARVSLIVGTATTALSLLLGTSLGLLAASRRGWLDEIIMRLVDVLLAFPGILLAMAIAAVRGPSLGNVVVALGAIAWTPTARLVRAEALSLLARPHVDAARALGSSTPRLLFRHILPLLSGPLAVQATFGFAGAVVAESGLSFLGLGTAPPTPSWGAMLNEGRAFLLVAPHVALVPATAIFTVVLGVNLLGEELRGRFSGETVSAGSADSKSSSGLPGRGA